jgi:hypothetical protein
MLTTIRFRLPHNRVLTTNVNERVITPAYKAPEFRFPAALSSSLKLIFIMGVIIQPTPSKAMMEKGYLQYLLFDPRCPYNDGDEELLHNLHKPRYDRVPKVWSQTKRRNLSVHPCHAWFRCCFSPCEQYLIVIKGSGPPDSLRMFSSWVLDVYERVTQTPQFQRIAAVGLRLNGLASYSMTFHPTKPVLALSLLHATVLWHFSQKGSSCFPPCLELSRF